MAFRHIASTQWKKYLEGMNKPLGGEVSNVKVSDPAATREPFTISYEVRKANFVDWSKKTFQLKLPLSSVTLTSVSVNIDEESEDEDAECSGAESLSLAPRTSISTGSSWNWLQDIPSMFRLQPW